MSQFTILLGGDLKVTRRLIRQVAGTRVIAADSGMRHAAALRTDAELWVGDFDSAEADLQRRHPQTPRDVHPADKDRTDGEIAIDAALAKGASALILAGGLGGQTDHALAHVMQMLALALRGIPTLISSGSEEAYPLLPGRRRLELPPGSRLSVIALGGLTGLDLEGVRWPLAKADIPLGSTRTLSNVTVEPVVEIGLAAGSGIVLAYPAEEAGREVAHCE